MEEKETAVSSNNITKAKSLGQIGLYRRPLWLMVEKKNMEGAAQELKKYSTPKLFFCIYVYFCILIRHNS